MASDVAHHAHQCRDNGEGAGRGHVDHRASEVMTFFNCTTLAAFAYAYAVAVSFKTANGVDRVAISSFFTNRNGHDSSGIVVSTSQRRGERS